MLAPALLLISAITTMPLGLSGSVGADAGLEYDSNANRAPSDGSLGPDELPRGGPLLRELISSQLNYQGSGQLLHLQLQTGGKLFLTPDVQDQNVGVISANYEHLARLGRLLLGGALDYYDAYQAPATVIDSRDFRLLGAMARLTASRLIGAGRKQRIFGGLDLGGIFFQYKPDDSYSFLAPSILGRLGASLHAGDPDLGHDFDLAAHVRVDYRSYLIGRTDVFVETGVSATWQGPLLAQIGYTVQFDLSDVSDQSYQRHLFLAKLAFRIPGDFYVTAKTQLDLLEGTAGLVLPVSNIDDDNRSLALLNIARPLSHGLSIVARYAGYFSLPNDSTPYQRHTAYLGLSYLWKARRP
jgi:hypothetical protein